MKKSYLGLIILLILLTTYTPGINSFFNLRLNIEKIIITNNSIIDEKTIKQKLNFLYKKNLFFLNNNEIEENLKDNTFIESFSIKKIYPNKLKIIIVEKKAIAILHNKKRIFYISDKGNLIDFKQIDSYKDLPIVFGSGKEFYSVYKNILNTKFPLKKIKYFYFFESGRWDFVMHDDKIIKLPVNDYSTSLRSFMNLRNDKKFNNYKIYDFRIKDQLILK